MFLILTITLNPSIDRRYTLQEFEKGEIFRTEDVQYTPGGKGLNVTKVIHSFQESVMATGLLGGFSGEYISSELNQADINHNFISINGETRSCLAIISDNGVQTEVLESGPVITEDEMRKFENLYKNLIKDYDIIVASGSLPRGTPVSTYKELIAHGKAKGKKFILDTSGKALKYGIEASPFLVKPNKEELKSLIGRPLETEQDIIDGANYILNKGVNIVVVSLGKDGSLVFHKDQVYKVRVPKIKAINPVGSGDAMIAGFAISLARDYDFQYMLKFATACGTANAMEAETGKVNRDNIESIMDRVMIEEIQ
ncbi:1-phosphofructokinase [Schnuerera ultunensis]|uniref:1-phosphofructokinase n=1 Tax=Schnuerera ultunensis TaxID=45497 RepID=UPI003C7656DE